MLEPFRRSGVFYKNEAEIRSNSLVNQRNNNMYKNTVISWANATNSITNPRGISLGPVKER